MMSVSVSSGEGNGNGSEEFQLEQQQQQEQKHEDDEYELDNRSIPSATVATATATATTSSSEPLLLDHFNPDIVDAMLAKEIDDLPFQERNDIYEEIHGVSNMAMKETPQLIEESLQRLSEELDNIDNNNNNDNDNNDNSHDTSVIESKKYYDYAQSCAAKQQQQQEQEQEPAYMHNDFRLRFLRCELFNPKLAAKRICHFYNLLYILYGYKGIETFVSLTLTTTITSNTNIDINANTDIKNSSNTKNSNKDSKSGEKNSNNHKQTKTTTATAATTTTTTTLMDFFFGDNKNDMMLFKSGYIQCLPFRDRSGRKIIVLNLDSIANLKSTIRLKIWIYMIFVASEDIETQRNGVVVIFWPGMDNVEGHLPDSRHRLLVKQSFMGIPTRFASVHLCCPNTYFFTILRSVLTLVLSPLKRVRVKIHTGERMEMQYELMGYGIPISLIPTTETGRLKTKNCLQWIKARKLLEQYNNNNNNNDNNNNTVNNKVTRTNSRQGYNNNDDDDFLFEEEIQTSSALKNDDDDDDDDGIVRIECPGVNDVIFRSAGKSCMNNPGNVVFRGIFENYHDEHVAANQTNKKNIIWSIVEEIENSNGKFLKWDKRGWWIPIHDRNEIRSKIAISFRDYNKRRRADLNQQLIKSSTYAFKRQDGKRRMGFIQTGNKNSDSRTRSSCCGEDEEGGTSSDGGSSSSCVPSNCMKRSFVVV